MIRADARFDSPDRIADLDLLEPTTRQLVEKIVAAAAQMGMPVMVFETYRSQERQQLLFTNGASKLRTVGVHHYGLACDIVRVIGNEPSWKGDYGFLGQLAHSSALIWGGDWGAPNIRHSFVDSVHVQRCTIARQPGLFAGNWYPDELYNPYAESEQHLLFASVTQPAKPGSAVAKPRARKQTA